MFFLLNSRLFFLQTKIYPTLQKLIGQISNIVLNIFLSREVRDKNKESSPGVEANENVQSIHIFYLHVYVYVL
jgi:predicted glycosyltransferase